MQQPLVVKAVDAQEAIEAAGGDEGQRGVALQAPHAAPHPLQALQQPPWGGERVHFNLPGPSRPHFTFQDLPNPIEPIQ